MNHLGHSLNPNYQQIIKKNDFNKKYKSKPKPNKRINSQNIIKNNNNISLPPIPGGKEVYPQFSNKKRPKNTSMDIKYGNQINIHKLNFNNNLRNNPSQNQIHNLKQNEQNKDVFMDNKFRNQVNVHNPFFGNNIRTTPNKNQNQNLIQNIQNKDILMENRFGNEINVHNQDLGNNFRTTPNKNNNQNLIQNRQNKDILMENRFGNIEKNVRNTPSKNEQDRNISTLTKFINEYRLPKQFKDISFDILGEK